jgi:hypothetical protein
LFLLGVFAANGALAAGVLAVPDDNVNNPQALPYSSSFHIQTGTSTKTIAPSDGTITISFSGTVLQTPAPHNCQIRVRIFYRNSANTAWLQGNTYYKTIVPGTTSYTVNASLPSGVRFYVNFHKDDYPGYYLDSSFTVSN